MLHVSHIVTILFLSLVVLASCQTFDWGECDDHDIEPVRNFNSSRHLGHWYEIERFFYIFEIGKKCVEFNYSLRNNVVTLIKTSVSRFFGAQYEVTYTHQIPDPSQPARNSFLPGLALPLTTYIIMDTDYNSYSVSWGCKSIFGIFHFDYVWIMARRPTLPAATLQRIRQFLQSKDLHPDDLIRTDRTNCPNTQQG